MVYIVFFFGFLNGVQGWNLCVEVVPPYPLVHNLLVIAI
jgi:hypothetical protein